MKLSAPKFVWWIVSLVLGAIGLIGVLVPTFPVAGAYAVWFVLIGLALLLIATAVKGM